MKPRMGRPDRERGEALAELLVTIAIIGITVVAIVGALADSIYASSTHRQYASADTIAIGTAIAESGLIIARLSRLSAHTCEPYRSGTDRGCSDRGTAKAPARKSVYARHIADDKSDRGETPEVKPEVP